MAKQKFLVIYAAGAYLNGNFYPEGSVVTLDLKDGQRKPLWAQPCDDAGIAIGSATFEEVHTIEQKLGDTLGNKIAAAAGEPPAAPPAPTPDATKASQIVEALKLLDHADDAHWTRDGRPNINVLVETLGFKITKADLAAAAPDFVRDAVQAA